MSYTVEQINKAFESRTEAHRKAMRLIDRDAIMRELSSSYKLPLEKMTTISGQILFVLLGLGKAGDFYDTVKSMTGLSDEVLIKLVGEINNKIFLPFRQAMIAFSYEPEPEEEIVLEPHVTNPRITLNFPDPTTSTESSDTAILKSTGIEIDEDVGEGVREALEDASAQSINRDALLKTLENPPHVESSIQRPIQSTPVVTGIDNEVERKKIHFPQHIIPQVPTGQPQGIPAFIGSNTQTTSIPPSTPILNPNPPTNTKSLGIVGSKLQATFKIPAETSNYTVPIMGEKKGGDPYRETV